MYPVTPLRVVTALLVAHVAAAQEPGQRLTTDVLVAAVTVRGDTTAVSYRVHNHTTSVDDFWTLSVPMLASYVKVSTPVPTGGWLADSSSQGRPVARWSMLGTRLPPGGTTPQMAYESIGLPGVTDAWVGGYFPLDTADVDFDIIPVDSIPDPLTHRKNRIQVIGVVRADSTSTPLAMIADQDTLTRFVCQQPGWTIPTVTCNELLTELKDAARDEASGNRAAALLRITTYRARLTGARGTSLPEPAFVTLDATAAWLMTRMLVP